MPIEERINAMLPLLDERQKRIFLAMEAKTYGRGGISLVSQISGASRNTIRQGLREIEAGKNVETGKVRSVGGGRKTIQDNHPAIEQCIHEIIDGKTYGNPERVLSYTTLSLRKIQETLEEDYGIKACFKTIGNVLDEIGYSKQANKKMLQVGTAHPDRNEQFEFINEKACKFIKKGIPVISVDTKKKELLGNFKNSGKEYRKKRDPRLVYDHDFQISELGKVAPYGVYVVNDNTGFINLGTDHDTAEFAAESILRWWENLGRVSFAKAKKLYINCDNGGSNGSRLKLWKYEIQQLADYTGLEIHVSHFPPGTSKWNKIEHRMFCYISKNWEGQPLVDVETVVNLISSTTTRTGLKIECMVDENKYELKRQVSDEEMKNIRIYRCEKLGDWNYYIKPHKKM